MVWKCKKMPHVQLFFLPPMHGNANLFTFFSFFLSRFELGFAGQLGGRGFFFLSNLLYIFFCFIKKCLLLFPRGLQGDDLIRYDRRRSIRADVCVRVCVGGVWHRGVLVLVKVLYLSIYLSTI